MKIGAFKFPDTIKTVLWDMDGVIIDSLELDYQICSPLASKYTGKELSVSPELIRRYFAYAHREFWEAVLSELGCALDESTMDKLVEEYHLARETFRYTILPGVVETLNLLMLHGLDSAVVSSNETELIEIILKDLQLRKCFKEVVGYDRAIPGMEPLRKKPAPDMYLGALKLLNLEPAEAIVIEDSLAGAEAGLGAGCIVLGVATGSADFEALEGYLKGKGSYVIRNLG